MYHEYEPIESDGTILKRVRAFLNTIGYSDVFVSSGLPEAIPTKMVWLTLEDGSTISEGYQAILVRVKCLHETWTDAEKLAIKVRSFVESEDFLIAPIYRVDDTSRPRRSDEFSESEKPAYLFNFSMYQLAINL
jgi:hypothetical protein